MTVEAHHDESGNLRLTLSLGMDGEGNLPEEFTILPAGKTDTSKGPVVFSDKSAEAVMQAFSKHGQPDLPIDYDHGMLAAVTTPEGSKAAGWFVPEVRDGALIATNVQWTTPARKALLNREYRYLSPALYHDDKGNVTRLVNVALTNLPATRNMSPLVANQTHQPPTQGKDNAMSETMLALLNVSDEAEGIKRLNGVIHGYDAMRNALGAVDHDEAVEKIKKLNDSNVELATKVRDLEKQAEEQERGALLAQLHDDGKLPQSLMPWAETQPLSVLQSYSAHAPVDHKKGEATPRPTEEAVKLSDAQKQAAKVLHMSEAEYIEAMKAEKEAV